MGTLRFYWKPVLAIASANLLMLGLIVNLLSTGQTENSAPARAEVTAGMSSFLASCDRAAGIANGPPTRSTVELKAHAARVFEAEKAKETRDTPFLAALSIALRFQEFARVEQLLIQYDCAQRI